MTALVMFVLLAFATWRLSYMLVWESGPLDILWKVRIWFGVGYDENGWPSVATTEKRWRRLFGGVLSCVWCLSVWISFVFCAFYVGWKILFPVWWFAVSGAAILINEVIGDD